MPFCSACGAEIARGGAFCPNCGKFAASGESASSGASRLAPVVTESAALVEPAIPLPENVAGMFAYFTVIPAIIFLLKEPFNHNRFVRFHSFQCLFSAAVLILIGVALTLVSSILHFVPVLGWFVTALLWPLCGLAVLTLWLLLVVKAYQHQMLKLPIVGDLSEKQADV